MATSTSTPTSLAGEPSSAPTALGGTSKPSADDVGDAEEQDDCGLSSGCFFNTDLYFMDYYDLGSTLGSGSFAVTKRCFHKRTQRSFAAKVLRLVGLSASDRAGIAAEVKALKCLRNRPNVCRLWEVFQEREETLYMVLDELRGGELLDRLLQKRRYMESEAKQAVRDIARGVQHCHKNGVVHRDLKLENLVYADDSPSAPLKIADFGFCAIQADHGDGLTTTCGSPRFVAPEVISQIPYTEKCDMWSLGVIIYLLLCGDPPFPQSSLPELYTAIRAGSYGYNEDDWSHISAEARDLIDKLLVVDFQSRCSATEVLAHPWLSVTEDHDIGFALSHLRVFKSSRLKAGMLATKHMVRLQRGFRSQTEPELSTRRSGRPRAGTDDQRRGSTTCVIS